MWGRNFVILCIILSFLFIIFVRTFVGNKLNIVEDLPGCQRVTGRCSFHWTLIESCAVPVGWQRLGVRWRSGPLAEPLNTSVGWEREFELRRPVTLGLRVVS